MLLLCETGSCSVVWVDLELGILLPQLPDCWDYSTTIWLRTRLSLEHFILNVLDSLELKRGVQRGVRVVLGKIVERRRNLKKDP